MVIYLPFRMLRRELLKTLCVCVYSTGPVFLDHRDELEGTYKVYCQNHDEAISLQRLAVAERGL